jgi:hypothetical protein
LCASCIMDTHIIPLTVCMILNTRPCSRTIFIYNKNHVYTGSYYIPGMIDGIYMHPYVLHFPYRYPGSRQMTGVTISTFFGAAAVNQCTDINK